MQSSQTPPALQALRMPFGKYRGQPIEQIPDEYLLWLGCLDDLRPPLLGHVLHEMARRLASGLRVTNEPPTYQPQQEGVTT